MTESAQILADDLAALRKTIGKQARRYKMTPMIGRSHGIHAEPITFGLKLALMFDEFGRAEERLAQTRERIRVGKLSGAVGTHAHLDPRIEREVCQKLGLKAGDNLDPDRPARSACGIFDDTGIDRVERSTAGPPNSAISNALKCWKWRNFLAKARKVARPCPTNAIRLPVND